MKWLMCLLVAAGLTACVQPVDESKLRIVEVQLTGAEKGYKRETIVEFLDTSRKMSFSRSVYCRDWNRSESLKSEIGNTFKVYDLSRSLVPNYYNLGDRFC